MLTLAQFLALPQEGRCEYIHLMCPFILYRQEDETTLVNLYYAGDFFIEVWFDCQVENIKRVKPFTNSSYLEAYLHRIDLAELLRK